MANLEPLVGAYTPQEAMEIVSRTGARRGRMRPDKIFFSAWSSGCLISFSCTAFMVINASPWLHENAPGIIRMIGGLIFPTGIVMIV